jgi:hypothetical protein
MNLGPNADIHIFRIPLDVAGEQVFNLQSGYVHLWQFERTGGLLDLDGRVFCNFSSLADGEELPMGYNSRIQLVPKVDRWRMRWDAQAGRTAVLLVAADAKNIEANNVPARQLVTSAAGTSVNYGVVSIANTVTLIRGADVTRYRLLVRAPISNVGTVWIGNSAVTSATGFPLEPGEVFEVTNTTGTIRAIAATATGNSVRWWEEVA